jgi:hypothetical protein
MYLRLLKRRSRESKEAGKREIRLNMFVGRRDVLCLFWVRLLGRGNIFVSRPLSVRLQIFHFLSVQRFKVGPSIQYIIILNKVVLKGSTRDVDHAARGLNLGFGFNFASTTICSKSIRQHKFYANGFVLELLLPQICTIPRFAIPLHKPAECHCENWPTLCCDPSSPHFCMACQHTILVS